MINKNLEKRFWEIDFLRGIAIILMLSYHFLYDLDFFKIYPLAITSGGWWYFSRFIASIFIFLVGVSLALSYARAKRRKKRKLFPKYLTRGLKIFSWGLIITLITWLFLRKGFVLFGVLHLIGLSIILAYPFLKFRSLNLLVGVIIIFLGGYLNSFNVNFSWLLWLGLKTKNFFSLDYLPLFPWLGVVLIGLFFGKFFYPDYQRKVNLPDLSKNFLIRGLCFLGRKSLLIYLIHQPVLVILLYLFNIVNLTN